MKKQLGYFLALALFVWLFTDPATAGPVVTLDENG